MADREFKTLYAPAQVKAADESGDTGVIEAFASIFGNVDSYGDRMMPGAFTRTLAEWAAKGDPVPVILSHQWDDVFAYLGGTTEIAERTIGEKSGLWYRAELDLTDRATARTFSLLKRRLITQQSFAFRTVKSQWVEEDDQQWPVREVTDVDLFEVGPTLVGANTETELIEAASAQRRAAADQLHRKNQAAGDTGRTVDPDKHAMVVGLLSRPRHTPMREQA